MIEFPPKPPYVRTPYLEPPDDNPLGASTSADVENPEEAADPGPAVSPSDGDADTGETENSVGSDAQHHTDSDLEHRAENHPDRHSGDDNSSDAETEANAGDDSSSDGDAECDPELENDENPSDAAEASRARELVFAELGDERVYQLMRGWVSVPGIMDSTYWIGEFGVALIRANDTVTMYCIHANDGTCSWETILALVVLLQSRGGEARFHQLANPVRPFPEEVAEIAYELHLYWSFLLALSLLEELRPFEAQRRERELTRSYCAAPLHPDIVDVA